MGPNTIKVKVTAEDGTTTQTYTVMVTQETAVPSDVTAPVVDFPSVNNPGTEVVLPFGEALNWLEASEVPLVAAFTLSVEGAERDIDTLEWRTELQVAGGALVLTPASVIYQGQTVVVSYDKSKADQLAIADLANNKLESFTTGSGGVDAVANFSTVLSVSAPTNFTAGVGNAQVTLSWDAPASGSGITRHDYRFKTTGGYPTTWTQIPDSGNEGGHTVTGLTNEVAHTLPLGRDCLERPATAVHREGGARRAKYFLTTHNPQPVPAASRGREPPGVASLQPADGRRPAVVHAGKDARDPRNAVVPT